MADALGVIAGEGRFPFLVTEQAKKQGLRVIAIALKGVTDDALQDHADAMHVFKLGQISAPLKLLKKEGVSRVVMAGRVRHVSLFGGVLPDLRAAKMLAALKDRRTDTILGALADEFAKEGIELLPSSTYLTHLMPKAGVLGKRKPNKKELEDIEIGWRAAKAVAGFDIGQSVVVKDRAVIAVEAMEGTDQTVLRAGELVRSFGQSPGVVLVKVAKPKQDLRFDLPVIGLGTLKSLEAAGATALAVEAGKTLLFDQEEFLAGADRLNIAVVAREDNPQ